MVNLVMKGLVITLWISVFTTSALEELEDVVYRQVHSNDSVEFSCDYPNTGKDLFAFTLNRGNPAKKVLYFNLNSDPNIKDERFENRVSVRNNPSNQIVVVSISPLWAEDSDLYTCVFHCEGPRGFEDHPGKKKVVLFVQGSHGELCSSKGKSGSCYNYEPLLFALSAAAGLLFITVVILGAAYYKNPKRRSQPGPQLSVPVYEEMNGVRQKVTPVQNAEEAMSLYTQPKKENPYCSARRDAS